VGEEIQTSIFTDADFEAFEDRLSEETALLEKWGNDGRFSEGAYMVGAELEAWLVGPDMRPQPRNAEFLQRQGGDMVVPELSAFNVEFNVTPQPLSGSALGALEQGLSEIWRGAESTAADMNLALMMIGILPTVADTELTIENMSSWERYRALNEQILQARQGRAISLDITGADVLQANHFDVMLEAAATSFQIHLKVPASQSARFYNASKIVSAPLVAASANSPFLFGKQLWEETRIPLFEQAVSVGDWDYSERVTFGVGYVDDSLVECFRSNRQRYPVLLPAVEDTPPERMRHLRMHNGTIWRWNRPLLGFDPDGTPHFRIEQRVVPAGPSIADSIANAAFYYGMVTMIAKDDTPPARRMPFGIARDNFYEAAKHGLNANIAWQRNRKGSVQELILEELLPLAEEGLRTLNIDQADSWHYLGIIRDRVTTGQNGAAWQRAFVARYGPDMQALCAAYLERQQTGVPVHEWAL
jgi:gamma-glutamyl:cysteine ligase YbdK (ATP-grasp superfamily)